MQIKVAINLKNRDKVLALINELVEAEALAFPDHPSEERIRVRTNNAQSPSPKLHTPLDCCFKGSDLKLSQPKILNRPLGSWAMFNSFLPGKAALRVLAHSLVNKKGEIISFGEVIEESVRDIKTRRFTDLRGFPGGRKASSVPRFANHLVRPYIEMGMMVSLGSSTGNEVTESGSLGISEAGLQFSLLESPVFDGNSMKPQLSIAERSWITQYLKRIEQSGFREYAILNLLTQFIRDQNPTRDSLVEWFWRLPQFQESITSTSGYSPRAGNSRERPSNIASTYVSSKIALLRELGVLSHTRGIYTVEASL